MIRLNLAQIYYPPSSKVIEAMKKQVERANVYPEIGNPTLKKEMSKYFKVNEENILPVHGIDEAVHALTDLYKGEVVIPTPNYGEYELAAKARNFKVHYAYSLDENSFHLNIPDKLLQEASIIWISNPNNPTGCTIEREEIINLLKNTKAIVAIDECYFEFYGETVVDLINEYDNLVVFRGFAKTFALGGLRIGFVIANKKIIDKLQPIIQPFNISTVATVACIETIKDLDYYKEKWKEMAEIREFFKKELEKLGIKVYNSTTNFILAKFKSEEESDKVFEALKSEGIITCYHFPFAVIDMKGPYIRITINKKEIMQKVIDVVKKVVV